MTDQIKPKEPAMGKDNDIFGPAFDEEIVLFVKKPKITGHKPAFFCNGFFS